MLISNYAVIQKTNHFGSDFRVKIVDFQKSKKKFNYLNQI